MRRSRGLTLLVLAVIASACARKHDMDTWIRAWNGGSGAALAAALAREFPAATDADRSSALERVATGPFSASSTRAAQALCHLAGLGEPCDTAYERSNKSGSEPTKPQWFVWIAGYSYSWICNSGLSACYFEFDDQHFADRIRAYEAIGAEQAASVLREADLAFGPDGPATTLEGRQAKIGETLDARLDELSRRFWQCGDEIGTRSYLYALAHPDDFRLP